LGWELYHSGQSERDIPGLNVQSSDNENKSSFWWLWLSLRLLLLHDNLKFGGGGCDGSCTIGLEQGVMASPHLAQLKQDRSTSHSCEVNGLGKDVSPNGHPQASHSETGGV